MDNETLQRMLHEIMQRDPANWPYSKVRDHGTKAVMRAFKDAYGKELAAPHLNGSHRCSAWACVIDRFPCLPMVFEKTTHSDGQHPTTHKVLHPCSPMCHMWGLPHTSRHGMLHARPHTNCGKFIIFICRQTAEWHVCDDHCQLASLMSLDPKEEKWDPGMNYGDGPVKHLTAWDRINDELFNNYPKSNERYMAFHSAQLIENRQIRRGRIFNHGSSVIMCPVSGIVIRQQHVVSTRNQLRTGTYHKDTTAPRIRTTNRDKQKMRVQDMNQQNAALADGKIRSIVRLKWGNGAWSKYWVSNLPWMVTYIDSIMFGEARRRVILQKHKQIQAKTDNHHMRHVVAHYASLNAAIHPQIARILALRAARSELAPIRPIIRIMDTPALGVDPIVIQKRLCTLWALQCIEMIESLATLCQRIETVFSADRYHNRMNVLVFSILQTLSQGHTSQHDIETFRPDILLFSIIPGASEVDKYNMVSKEVTLCCSAITRALNTIFDHKHQGIPVDRDMIQSTRLSDQAIYYMIEDDIVTLFGLERKKRNKMVPTSDMWRNL